MPINFRWHVQNRILVVEHVGQVTVAEMDATLSRYIKTLDAAPGPVHLLADWRHTLSYPLQFSMVSQALSILRHRNMGFVALVGITPSVSFWLDFFTRLIPIRYRLFNNVDEALRFLEEIDRPQQVSS